MTNNNEPSPEFLSQMYTQMWQNINRHIIIVWQSVGAIGASVALLALSVDGAVPTAWTLSLIIVLAHWMIVHVYDAQAWFDRNLSIITRIERYFQAHIIIGNYVGKQRDRRLIQHLITQKVLGIAVIIFALIHSVRALGVPSSDDLISYAWLPWLALLFGVLWTIIAKRAWVKTYERSWSGFEGMNDSK